MFAEIFEFVRSNTEPGDEETKVNNVDLAQMTYPNSTATVMLNYQTHEAEIKMNDQEMQYSRIMQHYN